MQNILSKIDLKDVGLDAGETEHHHKGKAKAYLKNEKWW